MEYAMGKIESMETYAPAIISGAHHYWHILILGDGLFRFYYYSLLEKKMHFTVDATTVVVAGACQLMRPTSNRIPFPERPERRPPKEKKKRKPPISQCWLNACRLPFDSGIFGDK